MKEITREIMTLHLQNKRDFSNLLRKLSDYSLFFISLSGETTNRKGLQSGIYHNTKGEPLCFLSKEGAEFFLSCAEIDQSFSPTIRPFSKEDCHSFFPTKKKPVSFSLCAIPPITLSLSRETFFHTFFPSLLSPKRNADPTRLLTAPLPSGGLIPEGFTTSNITLHNARLFSFFPDLLETCLRKDAITGKVLDQKLGFPSGTTRRILNQTLTRLSLKELQSILSYFHLDAFLYLFSSYCPALKEFLFKERSYDEYSFVWLKTSPDKLPPDTMHLMAVEEVWDERGYLSFLFHFENVSGTVQKKVPVSYPFGLTIHGWYRLDPL